MSGREWTVEFQSTHDAKRALRKLRGRLGGLRLRDKLYVTAARLLIPFAALLLLIFGAISSDIFFAFFFGYLALDFFLDFIKPLILRQTMPEEFKDLIPSNVKLSSNGISTSSQNGMSWMAWSRVPLPEVYKSGLVFRIAPELAIPFPTAEVGADPVEIAAAIKTWKSTDA